MKQSFISRSVSFDMKRVVLQYMEALNTPRSLAVWLLFNTGEHDQLVNLKCEVSSYADLKAFRRDYLATRFLSKFDGLVLSTDKHAAAIQSFHKAESMCREANLRLFERGVPFGDAGTVIYRAREKIRRLLGDIDSRKLEVIFDACAFGPGVTTTCKGNWLGPENKLRKITEATTTLKRVLDGILTPSDYPTWPSLRESVRTDGNHVINVPKNAKTDRTIAIEPTANAFFQRGVGSYLRTKLRRWGVNLNCQNRNQAMARNGSLTGSFATIDLASASDTISIAAVQLLLPRSWSNFLEVLRSPAYFLDGKWARYHKHSSMGNGYTFELESLIFSSIVSVIAEGCSNKEWSVYGDDIILSPEGVPLLIECLDYLGFAVNTEKSFASGPFRESCGGDFYDGVQCTPFYFKRKDDIVQLITFLNWLRDSESIDFPVKAMWSALCKCIPRPWKVFGPRNSPGMVIHVSSWEYDPFSIYLKRRPFGPVLGYKVRVMDFEPLRRRPGDSESSLCGSLYRLHRGLATSISLLSDLEYERISHARKSGRWVARRIILSDYAEPRR